MRSSPRHDPDPSARPQRLRRAAAVTAVSCLALLAACGDDDDNDTVTAPTAPGDTTIPDDAPPAGDAAQYLRDSVDATLGLGQASFLVDAELAATGTEFTLHAEGSFDWNDLRGSVDIVGQQDEATQEVTTRSDGESVWFRLFESGDSVLPDGAEWLETDVERLADSGTATVQDMIGVVIGLLGAQDAEETGSETFDGVETRGFSTSVRYDDVVETAGDLSEAFAESLTLTGADATLHIDVWIGDDHIIRQLDLTIDSDAVDGQYEVSLSDVNEDVAAVDAPPAADVYDGPDADEIVDQLLDQG